MQAMTSLVILSRVMAVRLMLLYIGMRRGLANVKLTATP